MSRKEISFDLIALAYLLNYALLLIERQLFLMLIFLVMIFLVMIFLVMIFLVMIFLVMIFLMLIFLVMIFLAMIFLMLIFFMLILLKVFFFVPLPIYPLVFDSFHISFFLGLSFLIMKL